MYTILIEKAFLWGANSIPLPPAQKILRRKSTDCFSLDGLSFGILGIGLMRFVDLCQDT